MSPRTALLLGCGTIGREVARLLAADLAFDRIVVADSAAARAAAVAATLGDNAAAVEADGADESAVARLAEGAAVMLNTTGPFTTDVVAAMRGAARAGVPYADINDEAEVLWELFEAGEIDRAARQRGVPLVVGLGSSPGLTNIWARHLADQMDSVAEIRIALAMDPYYRSPAVFLHRFSVHGGPVRLFRDGRWTQLPGFGEEEAIRFPEPVGVVQVHLVGHSEPITLPRSFPTLRSVETKAGFYNDAANVVLRDVIRYGLTGTEPLTVGTTRLTPAEFTAAFLSSPAADHLFQGHQKHAPIARQVEVSGVKAGQPLRLTLQVVMAAGATVIALPLAVAARLLALRQVPTPGLLAPEMLDPYPFLEALEQFGIRLRLLREESSARFRRFSLDRPSGTV
jgi:saccharopine dehydrogenase-like NADP-dependent oxidoreductase